MYRSYDHFSTIYRYIHICFTKLAITLLTTYIISSLNIKQCSKSSIKTSWNKKHIAKFSNYYYYAKVSYLSINLNWWIYLLISKKNVQQHSKINGFLLLPTSIKIYFYRVLIYSSLLRFIYAPRKKNEKKPLINFRCMKVSNDFFLITFIEGFACIIRW